MALSDINYGNSIGEKWNLFDAHSGGWTTKFGLAPWIRLYYCMSRTA